MKIYVFIALIGTVVLGCSQKKDSTATPTVDLVGQWELVKFTVDPSPIQGTNDYLAYLRQIFGYNCSEINFYYNFKSDHTLSETTKSICQSGNSSDTLLTATWASTQTTLSLAMDDSSGTQQTQTYTMELHPATSGKSAYMDLNSTRNGTKYSISLNKQ